MSELTLTEPEVFTGHTDVICSTSIERIVTGRNAALAQIEALIQQLDDISTMTRSIGGKTALDWAMKQDFRCGCWLMEKTETAMKAITRNLDRGIWRDLMQRDRLADLERMLMILDGKPIPDNRADVTRRLGDHIHENRHSNRYEDEMFTIKYFQKGTVHITFKRPELVDKLNDIIARHYPAMLYRR